MGGGLDGQADQCVRGVPAPQPELRSALLWGLPLAAPCAPCRQGEPGYLHLTGGTRSAPKGRHGTEKGNGLSPTKPPSLSNSTPFPSRARRGGRATQSPRPPPRGRASSVGTPCATSTVTRMVPHPPRDQGGLPTNWAPPLHKQKGQRGRGEVRTLGKPCPPCPTRSPGCQAPALPHLHPPPATRAGLSSG